MPSAPDILIEAMSEADLEQVIALGQATPELHDGDAPDFFSRETLAAWLASPHDPLLVARRGSRVEGFAIASFHPLARIGYLYDLALRPECRGQGLGSALVAALMERFAAAGAVEIWCLVHEDNAAAGRLFESFGLRRGRRFDIHVWLARDGDIGAPASRD